VSREAVADSVYHLELRQFPHNMCRFNISEGELRETILVPWAQERWVEFGERKWSPHQATLTVLRGPRIPFGQLTMGRGWRAAQRSGEDVTGELLAAVRAELAGGGGAGASAGAAFAGGAAVTGSGAVAAEPVSLAVGEDVERAPGEGRRVEQFAADSLGLELLGRLGGEAMPLRRAWELAAERNPDAVASATLALAEGAVESLLRAGLVAVVRGGAEGEGIVGEEAVGLVRDAASWAGVGEPGVVGLRRV
jgi:hypothetical protein